MRFGLAAEPPETLRKSIKRADQIAAFLEATRLAGFGEKEAARFFGRPKGIEPADFDLLPKPAKAVEKAFLARFQKIEAGRAR